jgi:hypothetical protein
MKKKVTETHCLVTTTSRYNRMFIYKVPCTVLLVWIAGIYLMYQRSNFKFKTNFFISLRHINRQAE